MGACASKPTPDATWLRPGKGHNKNVCKGLRKILKKIKIIFTELNSKRHGILVS